MKTLLCAAALALAASQENGCNETAPQQEMQIADPVVEAGPPRFTVTRVCVFTDRLAYNSRRAIYLLTDNKTGQEFVGISGVGIAELGEHQAGKTEKKDER